jgi:hypothetical protein
MAAMPLVVSADIQYSAVPPVADPDWTKAPAAVAPATQSAAVANITDFIRKSP